MVDGEVADLSAHWPSLRAALAAKGLPSLVAAAKTAPRIALADIQLLPVIPDPDKILCIGLNYASHVGEVGRELPKVPSVFSRLHNTLLPQGGSMIRPQASTHFDYEGELAIVIVDRYSMMVATSKIM